MHPIFKIWNSYAASATFKYYVFFESSYNGSQVMTLHIKNISFFFLFRLLSLLSESENFSRQFPLSDSQMDNKYNNRLNTKPQFIPSIHVFFLFELLYMYNHFVSNYECMNTQDFSKFNISIFCLWHWCQTPNTTGKWQSRNVYIAEQQSNGVLINSSLNTRVITTT